jgi:hypothetical protein
MPNRIVAYFGKTPDLVPSGKSRFEWELAGDDIHLPAAESAQVDVLRKRIFGPRTVGLVLSIPEFGKSPVSLSALTVEGLANKVQGEVIHRIAPSGGSDVISHPHPANLPPAPEGTMLNKAASSQIVQTIAEQLGGVRRLKMMLGATVMQVNDHTLGIKFPNKQRSKGNYVEIKYQRGPDTYDVEFFNLSIKDKKQVKRFSGVYADQLVDIFEGQTGWYLRMASDQNLTKQATRLAASLPEQSKLRRILMASVRLACPGHMGNPMQEPVGLSLAVDPNVSCGTCVYFCPTRKVCKFYGDFPVTDDMVCASWQAVSV